MCRSNCVLIGYQYSIVTFRLSATLVSQERLHMHAHNFVICRDSVSRPPSYLSPPSRLWSIRRAPSQSQTLCDGASIAPDRLLRPGCLRLCSLAVVNVTGSRTQRYDLHRGAWWSHSCRVLLVQNLYMWAICLQPVTLRRLCLPYWVALQYRECRTSTDPSGLNAYASKGHSCAKQERLLAAVNRQCGCRVGLQPQY